MPKFAIFSSPTCISCAFFMSHMPSTCKAKQESGLLVGLMHRRELNTIVSPAIGLCAV